MKQFINIYMDNSRPCPKHPSWVLAETTDEALRLLKGYKGQVKSLSIDHNISSDVFTSKIIASGLYADVIYLHGADNGAKVKALSSLLQAIGNGSLPSSVTVYSSSMPNYNSETGEFIKPE
jgi:hypothetical protein